jgi:hypothetical protein
MTCCETYALIESYVHAFIMLVSDCISILVTDGYLYPYWQRPDIYIHIGDYKYFVFILAATMIQMYLR